MEHRSTEAAPKCPRCRWLAAARFLSGLYDGLCDVADGSDSPALSAAIAEVGQRENDALATAARTHACDACLPWPLFTCTNCGCAPMRDSNLCARCAREE